MFECTEEDEATFIYYILLFFNYFEVHTRVLIIPFLQLLYVREKELTINTSHTRGIHTRSLKKYVHDEHTEYFKCSNVVTKNKMNDLLHSTSK